MKLSEQLKQTRDWLADHHCHLTAVLSDKTPFDEQLVDLGNAIVVAEQQEALIHASWEFMSGEWEPDDVERARHTTRLEAADND